MSEQNRVPWSDAMARAIDDSVALPEVRERLRLARKDAAQGAGGLDDLYAGAIDILNRWEEAHSIRATEPWRADIILNDYRPVRPYAVNLGSWIQAAEEG
jgi:hypothetical protein